MDRTTCHRRRVLLAVAFALLLAPLARPARAAREVCAPWPGEPDPLPTIDDADSARARWAELRMVELTRVAQQLEARASVESHRLWRRVLCLDPRSELGWRGVARTQPVRVYRPPLRWGAGRAATGDPWTSLAHPIRVARPAPAAPAEPPPELVRAAEFVEEGEAKLRGARFEEALEQALAARRELEDLEPAPADGALRVRLELVAAVAQVALGDEDGAQASLVRALAVDPALDLDPASTSPKVLRALEAARTQQGPTP